MIARAHDGHQQVESHLFAETLSQFKSFESFDASFKRPIHFLAFLKKTHCIHEGISIPCVEIIFLTKNDAGTGE